MKFITYLIPLLVPLLSSVNLALADGDPVQPGNVLRIKNPIAIDSIEGLLVALLEIMIILATPIIIFFIIYAGFLYVTARGNATQVQEATRAITYAIIGGVLVIGAVAITTIIENLVKSF